MLANILNLEGVNQLDRNQQVIVKGGEWHAPGLNCYGHTGSTNSQCH